MPAEVTPRMGLVFFAFGVAEVTPGAPLAGHVLIRLLADLGLSESAARTVLLRMRRGGWLESERSGREAQYRLAPVYYSASDRLNRQLRGERPQWAGSFNAVVYEIPERCRAYREQLRRTAQILGYALLRPGVLVATTDRWEELAALLPASPGGSRVFRARLEFSAEDSRRLARELWDLEALAGRYRTVVAAALQRIDNAERHPAGGAAALRDFAEIAQPLYEAGAGEPDLPAELLPPDWPADQLSAALGRAFRVFAPLISGYMAELAAGRSGAALPHDEAADLRS